MNSPKFNQSIYSSSLIFYEDVKRFTTKVYFVNAIAVQIHQSVSLSKFPVLQPVVKDKKLADLSF